MTEKQKSEIRRLRLDGNGYRHIAAALNLPLSSVKAYCRCHGLKGYGSVTALNDETTRESGLFCRQCGKRLHHTPGKRKKKFCSDYCRKKYWRDKNDN